jgi:endonuclease/exonuclease/phosphatase family metal-dependent hydrolase
VITSYPNNGCGWTAILIHPKFTITNSGVLQRGAAWATILIEQEHYSFASVYAPNTTNDRKRLWTAFNNLPTSIKWTIAGDFNMIEDPMDSTSASPLLCGSELDEWRILKMRLSLKDAAKLKHISGPRYTRRGSPNDKVVQSRLDRVYFSDWASWITELKEVRHHTTSILSDHDPVSVRIVISVKSNISSNRVRKSYFKTDAETS